MAEAAKDQDQSMEDILQSIKRIIAEEGEPTQATGSDVLELTELLAEDGSVSQARPDERPQIPTMSIEEIMAAPVSSMPMETAFVPSPSTPAPMSAPSPVTEMESAPVAPAPASDAAPMADDNLLSGETLSASVAALSALRDSMNAPSAAPRTDLAFRSGMTVEDLVREAIKPMLKDWLDQNLPLLVESLVKKEISKLTQH